LEVVASVPGGGVSVPTRALISAGARSVFLNGLLTVQRAQSLGFTFGLWPVLKSLYTRRSDRARAARAHLGFFSTHPYTVGVVLGVVAGLEVERCRGERSTEDILATRAAMAGPLAAIGEGFFWGTWLPFSLAVTGVAAMLYPGRALLIAGFFLLLYNTPHLGMRWSGFYLGYRHKGAVVGKLALLRLQRVMVAVTVVGAGLAALRLAVGPGGFTFRPFLWAGVFWGFLRLGVRPSLLAAGTAGACVIYSIGKAAL
jgi:PTS system mannose-specific IID component